MELSWVENLLRLLRFFAAIALVPALLDWDYGLRFLRMGEG